MAEGHDYHHEIAACRKDAEDLLAALGAETFPDDPAVRAVRDRVEQQALRLQRAAAEPITLGLVGEFTVGKSLLLGTLLGRADLLPVEQRATTGNVTALYLRPGEPGEPTRIDGDAEVQYLTRQELSACVRDILAELIRKYEQLPGRSAAELRDYDPIEQGWERFVAWCKRLWSHDADNPDIRKIPLELLAIRRAHLSGRELLGDMVPIGEHLVREALDLGPTEGLPKEYPELPVRPGITRTAVQRDPEALAVTFPLIRRVKYRVVVDPLVWGMKSLTAGNEVVLLDFPGLTAARSTERDAFLSRSELGSVHTIVVVFSMSRPGTHVPHQFYTMLATHGRDKAELDRSIIAVGNMFDVVPPPRVGDGPLTFADLAAGSQRLQEFLTNAGDLVQNQQERMTLVSAVRGLDHYGLSFDRFDSHEKDRLREAIPLADAAAGGWRPIAARLPEDHWGDTLRAFTRDGGIDRLRDLIERHAAENGLVNKVTLMRRERRRLLELLPRLERLLTPPPASDAERRKAVTVVRELIEQLRAQHKHLVQAAWEFQDPTRILIADGRPLLDWIRQQSVVSVCEWAAWQEILQRADRGFIRKTRRRTGDGRGRRRRFLVDDTVGDETTDTFYEPFTQSYRQTVRETRKLLGEAVISWVERHNERLSGVRDRLADQETRRYLESGLARLDAHAENRMRAIEALADLRVFMELDSGDEPPLLAAACADPVPGDDEISAAFPLHRGTALPWHSAVPEDPGDLDQKLTRHQLYVLRLRRQLANGLAEALCRRVIADLSTFHRLLRDELELALAAVPSMVQVRQMFPDEPTDGATPDGPPGDPPDDGGSAVRRLIMEWRARDAA